MKVKELIERLQKHDPNAMVVVNGYEGGYSELREVVNLPVVFNVNKEHYFGPHDDPRQDQEPDGIVVHLSNY